MHDGRHAVLDKLLRLNLKRLLTIGAAWVLCAVLHNAVYALLKGGLGLDVDEPLFFLLAVVVIPLYLAASLIYTVYQWSKWSGG